MITLRIKLGLKNAHVSRGKYGKGYYAQFWADTSEKKLVDFRRILYVTEGISKVESDIYIKSKFVGFQSYMRKSKSLI